ncbi:MAG: flagellar basal-body MS-ring/collar protein FliF [Verrucomicrobiota bacterium]|nr:flagellar basal-body MS-ring/collar protein FliF [Verrucomicrobiota bacterium]
MNTNFSQIGSQLLAIWKQLGINQRISIFLAAGVVIAGLASLAFFSSQTDYSLLYGKLDGAEAAKVISALDDAKVPYKISQHGGTILVPAEKVHFMRMQLAAKGIPRGEGIGFEIFDKPNFGISDFVQRANYLRAVQGELARTISQVDSIENARVMIVMPENRLLVDNQKKPTASVFVRVRGNAPLQPQTVAAIRFLVANSVEGLQSNHVTVVDNLGNVLSENSEPDSVVGLSNTQLAARKNMEQYLSKKAEGMLEAVLGPGQSVVRVSADLNFDTLSKTEERFDPEGQVVRSSTINDENTDTSSMNTPVAGGIPGVDSNATGETNSVATAPTTNNRTRKKVTKNEYEINKITSNLMQAAGGVSRVSAAVFIATKMEGTGTARKPVPRSKEELDKLRKIVQSALGIQENSATRKDEITLEEMPFNDQPALEVTQQLEKQETKQFWMNLAGQAVYPAIALGILLFFWRTFKKTPGESIPIGVPLGEFAMDSVTMPGLKGNGSNGNGMHGRKGQPGVVSVDVLNQLIKENPDNMTHAIRSWMAKGKGK